MLGILEVPNNIFIIKHSQHINFQSYHKVYRSIAHNDGEGGILFLLNEQSA